MSLGWCEGTAAVVIVIAVVFACNWFRKMTAEGAKQQMAEHEELKTVLNADSYQTLYEKSCEYIDELPRDRGLCELTIGAPSSDEPSDIGESSWQDEFSGLAEPIRILGDNADELKRQCRSELGRRQRLRLADEGRAWLAGQRQDDHAITADSCATLNRMAHEQLAELPRDGWGHSLYIEHTGLSDRMVVSGHDPQEIAQDLANRLRMWQQREVHKTLTKEVLLRLDELGEPIVADSSDELQRLVHNRLSAWDSQSPPVALADVHPDGSAQIDCETSDYLQAIMKYESLRLTVHHSGIGEELELEGDDSKLCKRLDAQLKKWRQTERVQAASERTEAVQSTMRGIDATLLRGVEAADQRTQARNAQRDITPATDADPATAHNVIDEVRSALSESSYPSTFPRSIDLEFHPDGRMLVVDFALPSPDVIPRIREVKYVKARDEFVEVPVPNSEANSRYDQLLYQISLRTLYEAFTADSGRAVQSVVLNGWVTAVDPATGHEVTSCVLSVQAAREPFLSLDLKNVDPKACFRALKGVGSSKLHSLAAVPPVATIDKHDSRFVAGYEVAQHLDDSANIAAMDWLDFENLIRELFEKEFASGGGEVHVTRASRDHGVDAIAFDPDPIRGGKIAIQAKRYTNTVGVAAVRDLYGTVINEGATKGILVTTSDYGPEAYEFAKGKPLTLLNGAHLLHLLERHGHRAKIDLKEAREALDSEPDV